MLVAIQLIPKGHCEITLRQIYAELVVDGIVGHYSTNGWYAILGAIAMRLHLGSPEIRSFIESLNDPDMMKCLDYLEGRYTSYILPDDWLKFRSMD